MRRREILPGEIYIEGGSPGGIGLICSTSLWRRKRAAARDQSPPSDLLSSNAPTTVVPISVKKYTD